MTKFLNAYNKWEESMQEMDEEYGDGYIHPATKLEDTVTQQEEIIENLIKLLRKGVYLMPANAPTEAVPWILKVHEYIKEVKGRY